MICDKCGVNLPDDSAFCTSCGATIENAGVAPTTEGTTRAPNMVMAEVKNKIMSANPKFNFNKIELAIGVVCIVFGIVMLVTTSLGLEEASFGADFYTYTYDGIYVAAKMLARLVRLAAVFTTGFGVFLVRDSNR